MENQISPLNKPTDVTEEMRALIELCRQGLYAEALARGEALAARFPDIAFIPNLLGAANDGLGRPQQAVTCFRAAVQLQPDYAEAHCNLGVVLHDLGRFTDAVASYRTALKFAPNDANTHTKLANALRSLGRLEEATASYHEALQIQADNAEAHNNLGIVLYELGRLEDSVASYLQALRVEPNNAEAHHNLGRALKDLGKHEEAIASYQRALQQNPRNAEALNNLGILLHDLGEPEAAVACYGEAVLLKPERAEWHRNLSTAKHYKADDPHIDQMLQLLERPDLPDRDRLRLCFALGKAYDDTGATDKAFACLVEANRLRKQELQYKPSSDRALFARIKSAYSDMAPLSTAVEQSHGTIPRRPIFIVGMPRSGTTLVEQILASHSRVYGGGELNLLGSLVNSAECNSTQFSAQHLHSIRNAYLSGLDKLGTSATFITDKMPHNFLWIGCIIAALPEALIVHVKRDARATCWSNFKHGFFEKGFGFTCDLQDVAEHYRMYVELMEFWHARIPGRIYDLNYEALTEHQEDETKRLLEHVGLHWEDRCLAFHTTKRAIRTASAQQVRQQMYQGSSDAWRKYEKHLELMVELLQGL